MYVTFKILVEERVVKARGPLGRRVLLDYGKSHNEVPRQHTVALLLDATNVLSPSPASGLL